MLAFVCKATQLWLSVENVISPRECHSFLNFSKFEQYGGEVSGLIIMEAMWQTLQMGIGWY